MNNRKPKVSVLMPVFNSLPFLKDSLKSILSQSFTDLEFIIVDDGSTDGSAELLKEYAKKDNRICVLQNEKNEGIVFSLNRGIKKSSGDYIIRMDADDIAMRERIEKQVKVMDNNPEIAVLGAAVSYIDSLGNELGLIRRCALGNANLTETPLLHPTVAIRRSLLMRHGIYYRQKYYSAQDYFFWLELSRVGKISAVDDVLLKYRITNKVSRVKELKKILWTTLRIKKDAVLVLKIKPKLKDFGRLFLELLLLLLPARAILFIYIKTTFRNGLRVNL